MYLYCDRTRKINKKMKTSRVCNFIDTTDKEQTKSV